MLKKAIQRGRRREKTGGVVFSPTHPELPEQFLTEGYVEDCVEPGTKLGKGAFRRAWVGRVRRRPFSAFYSMDDASDDPMAVVNHIDEEAG